MLSVFEMLCLSRFFSRLARFSSFIFFFSFASLGGRLQSADIDEKEIRKEKPEELVVALAHAKVILALFCSRTGFRCYIFFLWLVFRIKEGKHLPPLQRRGAF